MEHQNSMKPGFKIFFVLCLLGFFYASCASQKEPDEATQTLSDAAKPESPATDDAALSDLKEITKAPEETKPAETPAAETSPDLLAMKDTPKSETPPTEVPNAVPLTNVIPPTTSESAEKTADKLINDQSAADIPKDGAAIVVATEDPNKKAEIKEVEAAPPVRKKRKSKKLAKMTLPEIPTEALAQNGILLNRFYFIRKGDSPEKVSELLYGTPEKHTAITAWNSKEWKAGGIIFYNSPLQPQDREMKSFFQERNVPPERYQLRRGDSLTRLAKQKLGSPDSWTELAVVNGLTGSKDAEPGQTIALYPADLSNYTYKPPEIAKPIPAPGPVDEKAPSAIAENPNPKEDAPPVAEAPKKEKIEKKPENALDIGKLVEQNLLAVLIGAGVIVLGLSYRIAKKKGKGNGGGEDFGDDDAAPTQAKRR